MRHESKHDKEWELLVQSRIRGGKHKCTPAERIWVGVDEGGIAAVFRFELEDNTLDAIFLKLCAVSTRHRGQGGGVADEMMRTFVEEATDLAVGGEVGETVLSAHIHPKNKSSQDLARRHGFVQSSLFYEYQVWQTVLAFGPSPVH